MIVTCKRSFLFAAAFLILPQAKAESIEAVSSNLKGNCFASESNITCGPGWLSGSKEIGLNLSTSSIAGRELLELSEISLRWDETADDSNVLRLCLLDREGLKCQRLIPRESQGHNGVKQNFEFISGLNLKNLSMHNLYGACALEGGKAVCDHHASRWLGAMVRDFDDISGITVSTVGRFNNFFDRFTIDAYKDRAYGCILRDKKVQCYTTKYWPKYEVDKPAAPKVFPVGVLGLLSPRKLVAGDSSHFARHCVIDEGDTHEDPSVKCWISGAVFPDIEKEKVRDDYAQTMKLEAIVQPYELATDGFMGCVASKGLSLRTRVTCWSWDRHDATKFTSKFQEIDGEVISFAKDSPYCALIKESDTQNRSVFCFPEVVRRIYRTGPVPSYESDRVATLFWEENIPFMQRMNF